MTRRRLAVLAVSFALASMAPSVASACPNCKEAVASQGDTGDAYQVQRGYFWSILLMISAPIGLATAGVVAVARAVRSGALPEM